MTGLVTGIVIGGIGLALLLAVAVGVDGTAIVMLVFVLGAGALALATVRRMGSREVGPARCGECGGLLSPNSPYCKHCGAAT